MAGTSASFSGRNGYSYHIDSWETSTNSANNQSTIYWHAYIYADNVAYKPYDLGGSSYWSATIAGSTYGGNFNYDFRSWGVGSSQELGNGYITVTHGADGTASVGIDGYCNAASPLGSADPGATSYALTDFTRLPSAPSTPTWTRPVSGNAANVSLTSSVPSSPVTISAYKYRWSTDNSTWTEVSMGGSTTATFSGTATIGYYFQTAAYSTEGWGGWSSSAFAPGVPSAPQAISLSRTGRDVTVTISGSATNGGATISSYSVQYSTNGGSSWAGTQDITSGSYKYVGLTAAQTYLFRAYATNSTGSGSAITSTSMYVPSGGRIYNTSTSQWESVPVKYYDPSTSTWVDVQAVKYSSGGAWADVS